LDEVYKGMIEKAQNEKVAAGKAQEKNYLAKIKRKLRISNV
jgi:hypothetical protein